MACQYPLQTTLGSLGNDDDDGSENVAKKINLRLFKLYRVYSNPLNLSNVGDFAWSWILFQFQKEKRKFSANPAVDIVVTVAVNFS